MIAEQKDNRTSEASLTTIERVLYFGLPTLMIVGALIAYKSSGAMAVIGKVSVTGALTPQGNVIPLVGASGASFFTRTLNYFLVIWPALLFGILISGAVRALVPPRWLGRALGSGRVRPQLVAGLAGAPLMLCSCCAAPVFSGLYERSSRLGPSLAVMLAAPSLNPAALILTFMLFDHRIALTRLAIAGPAVNLPSLFTIARSTNWKVAASVALTIFVLSVAGGLLVSLF